MKKILIMCVALALCISSLVSCTVTMPTVVEQEDIFEKFMKEVNETENYTVLITQKYNEKVYLDYYLECTKKVEVKFDDNVRCITDSSDNSVTYIEYDQGSGAEYNRRYIYKRVGNSGWSNTIVEGEDKTSEAPELYYTEKVLRPEIFKKDKDNKNTYVNKKGFNYSGYDNCTVIIDEENNELLMEMKAKDKNLLDISITVKISNVGSTSFSKSYRH